jgi:hypothetical protein
VLGLLAIRCKYIKDFTYNLHTSPECEIAMLIRNNIKKIE